MAEPNALKPPDPDPTSDTGTPRAPGPALSSSPAQDIAPAPDRWGERATVYWILFLLLLVGSLLLQGSPWRSTPAFHTVVEAVATLLAFIVGGLALVRFYSRKQATFLLIGTGFLGAGLLDLNHLLLTSEYFLVLEGSAAEDLFAWSWTAERVFLSLFLFMSLLAWRQEVKEGEGEAVNEGSVYATALILTVINLLFFEWVPLSGSHITGFAITRPAEILPGIFFLLTFFGYLAKGSWRTDAFEHWLLVFLLISTMAHVGFMSMSEVRFDGMDDAAHLLKVASYTAMLTGLLFSVYLTFRREGVVLNALTGANEALAREVEVRSQTEQAVKEGSARLQEFLDNANDLIQSVGFDGTILYVNSAWKRTLGYTDEQIERLNLFQIVHPADASRLRAELDRVLSGESARNFNVDYVAGDGRIVMLSGSSAAQFSQGRPIATQGIFQDVTVQRRAERLLADSRANLAALVENTGDAIWSVDRSHRLITFNSAFSLAMEYRTGREPVVGRLPPDIFPSEDVAWYVDLYDRALQGDRHVVLRTDEMDGQTRYFELYANPVQGDDGITGAVLFGKDVTPRVRAEEALIVAKDEAEAANKAKSHFLANMSHELRTPLNSVIGFTNILLKNKEKSLAEKDLNFLQRVLANGKHLLELINQVLDLAKVEAGRMELVIEQVDLAHLVTETVQQLEGQAKVKEGNVVLVAAVPASVELVETDSAKLKQVIINLVGNALKFTHGGSVTVRLDMAADGRTPVAISVHDTGIGIPADRLGAVFEAFQQAEAGTSRKYGGTGLGLAISRSICLMLGYDLIVESEVGEGSTFSIVMGERAKGPIRVPEVEAAPQEPGTTAEPGVVGRADSGGAQPARSAWTSPTKRMRDFLVLVVDDEKDSRVLMEHYLEEFGCRVVSATNGEEGIAAAKEHRPDLITLDLMMPGMNGWDALQVLKADPDVRHIPVVVVSIVAGEGRGRLLGAVDLVTKPFEREDLLRVLWRNLVRKRGGRVLVVEDDLRARTIMYNFLVGLGLEVVTAQDGLDALEVIRVEAPDAVILDLVLPGLDAVGFLRRLRAVPAHTGLPVLVLSDRDLSADESRDLGDMASGVFRKGQGMTEELRRALGSMFALSSKEGNGA